MKIKKLPSGNYNAVVFSHTDPLSGKRIYESFTAPEKSDVMRLVADFKDRKKRGERPTDLTIGECVDRYIKSKEKVLSPNTARNYRQYTKHLAPIKDISLSRFSNEQFQAFIGIVSTDHAPKTVKNIYSLVISAIKMFTDRNFRVTLPQPRVYEYHLPSEDDIKNLMAIADDEMKMCIALASIGTLRRGEICGLKQKDIDRKNNTVYVHSDMIKNNGHGWIHKETPKTSSSVRYVIYPQRVIDLIPTGEPEEYIYKKSPSSLSDDFIDLRNELGLQCRFHDLRHYAASVLHAIGVPDQYIMERGGWKTDTVLKSVYRNTIANKSAEFTRKANEYLENRLFE